MAKITLVDLARTDQEKKAMSREYSAPVNPEMPDYPYGTCLYLDNATLDKLGMDKLPAVGSEIDIVAMGKVTSVSESADKDGVGGQRRLEIQITSLGVEDESAEAEDALNRAKKMYPDPDKD